MLIISKSYLKNRGSFWKASYDVLDEAHNPILKIQGPCCVCDGVLSCCCDNEFRVNKKVFLFGIENN